MASSVGTGYASRKAVANNSNLDLLVGFKPRRIVVHNLTNGYRAEWNEQLASGYAIVTATTGDRSVASSSGFSLLDGDSTNPPGFRLGALANLNDTTTEDLLFEVFGGNVLVP